MQLWLNKRTKPSVEGSTCKYSNEVVTEQVTVNQLTPVPQSVFFQIGSATLPQNSTVNLQQIANLVKDNPGIKLKVTGYADSDTGSASWNKQLSEDRANTVANELVKLGVNKSNMIISGMGGVNTLTPPAFNRRVLSKPNNTLP